MKDFVPKDTSSQTLILNYSTDSESSNIIVVATTDISSHQALLANVTIENETILSKNTNESLSKVMEQLSLLRRFEQDNIADKDDVISSMIPSRLEDFCPEYQDQLLYETTNSSFLRTADEFDDNLSPLYQEDSLNDIDSICNLSSDSYKKICKRNQLMKVKKYVPPQKFLDIQCSNVTSTGLDIIDIMDVNISNLKNSLQSNSTFIESIGDIMNEQSDSQSDSFIASIFENNIISSAINDTILQKNVKFHTNYDELSFIYTMENSENELLIRKKKLLKNKLKQYEAQLCDILEKKEIKVQKINSSEFDISKNILIDNGSHNISTNSMNASNRGINNFTNYFISENSSINYNIIKTDRKKSYPSDIEDYKTDDNSHGNIEEFLNNFEKNNFLDMLNDSRLQKTSLRDCTVTSLQNKNCDKINKTYEIEKVSNTQEVINDINNRKTKKNYNKQKDHTSFCNYRKFTKCSIDNSNDLKTFPENINNHYLIDYVLPGSTIAGIEDNDYLQKSTVSVNETIERNINISTKSAKVYNENERKRSNVYSCKNFSTYNKIKFDIAEIREKKQFQKRDQCIISNNKAIYKNKNFSILYESEDSLEFEENSMDIVKNVSDRVSARLRKGPKHYIKKRTHFKNKITEKDIRKVIYTIISKKNIKTPFSPQKKIIKKKLYKKYANDDIKFQLRLNSQNVLPKPKVKQHVRITELRKFILSKFPRSPDVHVFMDCENLIENINIAINKTCSKRANVNTVLLEFKMLLYDSNICKTVIEFYTFIMNYTPLYFQEKVIPLGGVFGCNAPKIDRTLSDPLIYT